MRLLIALGCVLVFAGCGSKKTAELAHLPEPVNQPAVVVEASDAANTAARALGQIGQPAVAALVETLADPDPVVRVRVCRALGSMGVLARDAVPALVHALSDTNPGVREAAARALGQIGEPAGPAVPGLIEMMQGKR